MQLAAQWLGGAGRRELPWPALALGLLAMLGSLAFSVDPDRAGGFVAVFLGIFLEAFPFLLLGVVVSAALEALVSPDRLQRLLPRGRLGGALAGSLLGLMVPACECGVVPIGRRLLLKGGPLSLSLAFILAGAAVNPVVIAATWVAFDGDPLIVFGRVGLSILVAVVVALVGSFYTGRPLAAGGEPSSSPPGAGRSTLADRCAHAIDELFEVGRYLVLGAALAAAVQTLVPRSTLLGLAQEPVASVAVMMALAALLSICSTVDAFVALAFAPAFGPGALLAFLVFGPMVDAKNALLFGGLFRRRLVVVTLGLTTQLVFLLAVTVKLNVG